MSAALVVAAPAAAQQPFVVDDADVTPPRVWHVEISTQVDLLRTSARPLRWQNTFELELDYGLLDRLEAACLLPIISLVSDGALAAGTTGIGDASASLKYRVTGQRDSAHALAATLSLELPTGSRARQLGSGLVDYTLNLVSQHRVSRTLTVRANGGAILAGNTQVGALGFKRRGTVLTAGASVVGGVRPWLQVGGEVTAAWSQNVDLGGSYAAWQLGTNVLIRRGMTLDASVLGGWAEATPRAGFQIGTSIDLNR